MAPLTDGTLARGDVLWSPAADARQRTELGRYLSVARARARAGLLRLPRAVALVRDRPRGLLGFHLGLLRDPGARPVRAGAGLPRDARGGVVPRGPDQLRRAHGRTGRGRRRRRDRRGLPDTRPFRAHVRRAARPGRTRPGGAPAARRRSRRPRRRLPPEHPRGPGRVPRQREPRGRLGDLPARVRHPQRAPPARAARAQGVARRGRLPLRRQADRPAGAGCRDQSRPTEPRDDRPRPLRRGRGRRAHRRSPLGRAHG